MQDIDTVARRELRTVMACVLLPLALGIAGIFLNALFNDVSSMFGSAAVQAAFFSGSVAAIATAAGVLPVLWRSAPSARTQDALLGFGAGVMLAATCFSLLLPALSAAREQYASSWISAGLVASGLLFGAFLLMLLERILPHAHPLVSDAPLQRQRLSLFVLAIVLHNIPEGLAIGVAAAGTDVARASALATGIAIQDIPEGLVVALALLAAGFSRGIAAAAGAASGLVEPLFAVIGAITLGISTALLPWGLAFAAGAMLFVVSHEVIPESHRQGHERYATGGLLIGFVLMMILDTALA
jgi:zinc transporter, ZIP family